MLPKSIYLERDSQDLTQDVKCCSLPSHWFMMDWSMVSISCEHSRDANCEKWSRIQRGRASNDGTVKVRQEHSLTYRRQSEGWKPLLLSKANRPVMALRGRVHPHENKQGNQPLCSRVTVPGLTGPISIAKTASLGSTSHEKEQLHMGPRQWRSWKPTSELACDFLFAFGRFRVIFACVRKGE